MANAARVPDLPPAGLSGKIVGVSILGTRVMRTEDPRFLTTGGVYTADVEDEQLAGACHVHFVRSVFAHARIRSVDVSAALEAPGGIAVFTAADLAGLPAGAGPVAGRGKRGDGPAAAPPQRGPVRRGAGGGGRHRGPVPGRGRRGPGGRGLRRAAAGRRDGRCRRTRGRRALPRRGHERGGFLR